MKCSLKLEHGRLTGDGAFSSKGWRSAPIQTQNANQVDLYDSFVYQEGGGDNQIRITLEPEVSDVGQWAEPK